MGWLRAKKGWGAGLALIALALQLVVAFGHVHRTGPAVASIAVADNSRGADNDLGDAGTGICQVCFTLAQTATGNVATPPPLAHPLHYAGAVFDVLPQITIAARPAASFWSRGPPIS